ncbi:MAG: response regulator, partial [Limnothrix sp.]
EEKIGLNVSEHQARNEFYELSLAIAHQTETQNLDKRVFVEPFTEAGLIAAQYNYLINTLAKNTHSLKTTNEELVVAKEKAEAANIAKSQFLTSMSHELRTPLNGILGITQILEESPNINVQDQENIELIHQSGSHLLELINDILDLSKIEAGKLEISLQTFNVRDFLQEIISLTKSQAELKGLDFITDFDAKLPKVAIADPIRLKQILLNLVGNAVKFTDQGYIHFSVTVMESQSLPPNHTCLEFAVGDTGVGIDQDSLQKLFLPFEQVGDQQQNAKGTGLGLSISRTLVQLMGGTLTVTSQLHIGSRFSFQVCVPTLTKALVNKTTAASTQAPDLQLGKKNPLKILVAEDNKVNQRVTRQLLQRIGYDMQLAETGLEVLAYLEANRCDVILMDLLMPDMGGLEATRQIYATYPPGDRPYIIALSANAMDEHLKEAKAAGMDDFVSKPIKLDELVQALSRCTPLPNS